MIRADILPALVTVDFHTEKELYSVQGTHSPTSILRTCTTTKQLSTPAGMWTTEFMGEYYFDKIAPMDLVVITMGREAGKLGTVMVGLVDEVSLTEQAGETRTQIRGRDFGKLLLKAVIKRFPGLKEEKAGALSVLTGSRVLLGLQSFFAENGIEKGTSAEFIDTILDALLKKIMQIDFVYWAGGLRKGTLNDILNYQLQEFEYTVPWFTTRDMFEGSIWNFIETARNSPFHELFLDTVSGADYNQVVRSATKRGGTGSVTFGNDSAKIGVFMRTTPFSPADWRNLRTHDITEDLIIRRSVGRTDHEHYNMFRVHPKVDFLGNSYAVDELIPPKFDIKNLEKFGLSFLDLQFEGMFDDQYQTEILEVSKQLTNVLQEWYGRNHLLESGTFVLRGDARYKIGQRIRHKRRGMVYYVESVNQNFQSFGTWQTTLSVTRGEKE